MKAESRWDRLMRIYTAMGYSENEAAELAAEAELADKAALPELWKQCRDRHVETVI